MKLRKTVTVAVVAAVYTALTVIFMPISFGAVQCRISEILTLLPVFSSCGTAGLTLGCFLSNIFSSVSPLDMVIGTFATFIAAVLTRKLRHIKLFNIPFWSLLSPVIVNAVIIGLEITLFVSEEATFTAFLLSAGSIAIGQTVPCVIIGIPLYLAILRSKLKDFLDK